MHGHQAATAYYLVGLRQDWRMSDMIWWSSGGRMEPNVNLTFPSKGVCRSFVLISVVAVVQFADRGKF